MEDWYSYQEEVEDIIENLVEGKKIAETEARIEQYRQENKAQQLQTSIAQLNETQHDDKTGRGIVTEVPAVDEAWKAWLDTSLRTDVKKDDLTQRQAVAAGWDRQLSSKRFMTEALSSLLY